MANTLQNIESPNSCLNSPLTSVGIQTLNEELGAQMLCWSWVFGCKTLNRPEGLSGNDSREVFYSCISPLGVYPIEENFPWSSTTFLVSLAVFLKNIKSAFPQRPLLPTNWKGAHALGKGLGYTLWPLRQTAQLSNVKKQQPTPLPTKIILFS